MNIKNNDKQNYSRFKITQLHIIKSEYFIILYFSICHQETDISIEKNAIKMVLIQLFSGLVK